MKVTFLIGNGFDLNCGLKCSYRDAYKGYLASESSLPVIAEFKKRISGNYETWADFELGMAADMVNYKSEQDFLLCLRDFKRYLDRYLYEQEETIKEEIRNDCVKKAIDREMRRSFRSYFAENAHDVAREVREMMGLEPVDFRVISFNYTTVFERMFQLAGLNKQISRIIHIHGQLQDDPVLGMDHLEQLPKTPYAISKKGERAFIKPTFNDEFDRARVLEAQQAIETSQVICAYGMSFGESDLTWRNLLLEWLRGSEDRHLFLYVYHCSMLPEMTVDERMDREEDEKIRILQKFHVAERDMEKYLPRLHIPCCKNIFNIREAIEKGLQEERKMQECTLVVPAMR